MAVTVCGSYMTALGGNVTTALKNDLTGTQSALMELIRMHVQYQFTVFKSHFTLKGILGKSVGLCKTIRRERINCTSVYLFLYGESSVKISTQTVSY